MTLFKSVIFMALLVPSLLLSAPAAAQNEGACRADVAKFCNGVQRGGGRIVACLKSHQSELSAGCQEQFAGPRERVHEPAKACKPDAERFCKGIVPGKGRVAACLKSHEADLSPECKNEMH